MLSIFYIFFYLHHTLIYLGFAIAIARHAAVEISERADLSVTTMLYYLNKTNILSLHSSSLSFDSYIIKTLNNFYFRLFQPEVAVHILFASLTTFVVFVM